MISDASDPCGPARYRLATADRILEAVRQVIARCADHLGEPVKQYRHTPVVASLLWAHNIILAVA